MSDTQNTEIEIEVPKKEEVLFTSFGFNANIEKAIAAKGFKVASPVQAQAIPFVMNGQDVVAQAQTGTGKTAAFGLPAIHNLKNNGSVEILVITPTRELANQVSDELYGLGRFSKVNTVTIYGGKSYRRQLELIERGAQIVVATPGRLLDLLKTKQLRNFEPSMVILDEADEMLDMGFLDDINEIFSHLPQERQTLLFSATMPMPIKKLAERILKEPKFVTVTREETTNTDIKQMYYVIEENERDNAMIRLMDSQEIGKTVVFCRMKREVDRVSTVLSAAGYSAKGLHGDMEQNSREAVIKAFKSTDLDILVATDVAARGLHINDITHVFNYHIPFDPESYVHRIGRTGRAGKKGTAITLLTPHEFKELQKIKSKVGTTMEHCFIPTKFDVQKQFFSNLVDEIEKTNVEDMAHEVVDKLKEDFDAETIMYKMATLLIKKQDIKGPNTIGIPKERLEAILERLKNSRGNGGNRGRGGYRGNRNRNGGGGRSHGGSSRGGSRNGGSNRNNGGSRGGNSNGGSSRWS